MMNPMRVLTGSESLMQSSKSVVDSLIVLGHMDLNLMVAHQQGWPARSLTIRSLTIRSLTIADR